MLVDGKGKEIPLESLHAYTLKELANTPKKKAFVRKLVKDLHSDPEVRSIMGLDHETCEQTTQRLIDEIEK